MSSRLTPYYAALRLIVFNQGPRGWLVKSTFPSSARASGGQLNCSVGTLQQNSKLKEHLVT